MKLRLKSGKIMHLKAESKDSSEKWVNALYRLGTFYRKKEIKDRDRVFNYKDQLDISILNAIMTEHESKYTHKMTLLVRATSIRSKASKKAKL